MYHSKVFQDRSIINKSVMINQKQKNIINKSVMINPKKENIWKNYGANLRPS